MSIPKSLNGNNNLSPGLAKQPRNGMTHHGRWDEQAYESASEEMAIDRFLKGKHFSSALDIGGGYGKLSVLLQKYADYVTLTEPDEQHLKVAKVFLKSHGAIKCRVMSPSKLDFENESIDLITLVRAMHHIKNPIKEFAEISRVLSPEGLAVIEVANYTHIRTRIKLYLRRDKVPTDPTSVNRYEHTGEKETFVNHNPHTVRKQLAHAGLKVDRILSVSNLHSPRLKRMMPRRILLAIEGILQPTLAGSFFGPSVYFLVRKP